MAEFQDQRSGAVMAGVLTSWQGVIASQERGGRTGFAVCRGGVLAFDLVVVSAVLANEGVVPVASVGCVLPRAEVIAAAVVIPRGATAEGDDDTALAQVVLGRANQVVARGWCRATRVIPRRGARVVQVVARWSCCLEKAVPVERKASCRGGRSVSGEHQRLWLRPSWCLPGHREAERVARALALERVVPARRRREASIRGSGARWFRVLE